jgi:POT family proton-dependent oligopeptide transporter
VIFAPLFAWLWIALSKRKLNPSTPLKFGLGLVQLGLGYFALYYGCVSNGSDGVVPIIWIVLGYLLHTTGEICLSPVGLSMVSKLAPPEMGAMVMGIWYLAFSVANIVGAGVARMTAVDTTELVTAADTVMVYGGVFGQLAAIAVGTGLFLAVLAPLLRRMMHGIR